MVTDKNRKRISIILIAYMRKNFILDAIQSIKDQNDFDSNEFEVIVVKNFADLDLDNEIIKMDCLLITSNNKGLGAKMVEGILKSTGDIICFLEDDDLFLPQKLMYVNKIFRENPDVVYVHNMYHAVDYYNRNISFFRLSNRGLCNKSDHIVSILNSTSSLNKSFNNDISHNLSSISVRREILTSYMELLKNIQSSPDLAIFVLALISNKTLFGSHKVLSLQRVSGSNYSIAFNIHTRLEVLRNWLKDLRLLKRTFCDKKTKNSLCSLFDIIEVQDEALESIYLRTISKHEIMILIAKLTKIKGKNIHTLQIILILIGMFLNKRLTTALENFRLSINAFLLHR